MPKTKSKLNLDIFSADTPPTNESPTSKPKPDSPSKEINTVQTDINTSDVPPVKIGTKPRFVPVGFHAEHLAALDEAVLTLRKQGYWNASKSSIIRTLINIHQKELAQVWLNNRDS